MLLPITAPQPTAGRRGLLRALIPLVGVDGWENGVTFDPESCDVVGPIDVGCWADADITKPPPTNPDIVAFRPFAVLGGDRCTATGSRSRDRRGRATRNLQATESFQVEREVFDGVVSVTRDEADHANPFLTNGTADEVTTAAVTPRSTLAAIERGLDECLHGQRGLIHATSDVVSLWSAEGLLRVEGELLLTALDSVVVAGSGYSGDQPDGTAAAAGSSWAYGTSMMYSLQSEIIDVSAGDAASRVDRSVNTETYIVERIVLVAWNPCCLVAGEVDLTATTAGSGGGGTGGVDGGTP